MPGFPGPLLFYFSGETRGKRDPREAAAPAKATAYTFPCPGDKGSVQHEKRARDSHR